ncbi:cytochrome c biogenesis protein DipZ [Patescibacteria group bacterium]
MIILLFFAFVSGLVTIFAPCIWPLLPIILSSSTGGGVKKPLGITLGVMLSFGFFTLATSYIVRIIPFDPNILRYIAVVIITILGLSLIVPKFSALLETLISKISGKLNIRTSTGKTGFAPGFVTGLSLGILWTPCAGPILATIATLAATRAVNTDVILVTVVYILGVGIPLLIFSLLGNYVFTKSKLLTKYTGKVQQVFGVIMILTALAILTNYDKTLQAKLLDAFPAYGNFIVDLETNSAVEKELQNLTNVDENVAKKETADMFDPTGRQDSQYFNKNYQAPDFVGINKWLNTEKEYSIDELKGKVVLIDFWTYTCINCIRTLPYVTSWYDKYKDDGLVVIGVHTPEFEFEKNTQNVLDAIEKYNIHYPVAQDNDFKTWRNYNNRYWPAKYLIDANGRVRRTHFGEGAYDETEKAIQILLKEAGSQVDNSLEKQPDSAPRMRLTPEIYLGSDRSEYYHPDRNLESGSYNFIQPKTLPDSRVSLGGEWIITEEHAVSGKSASLVLRFYANKVFLVMRPDESGRIKVKVNLDGTGINQAEDVVDGVVTVDSDRLYTLVDMDGEVGSHILTLDFIDPGVEIFAFTFGQ